MSTGPCRQSTTVRQLVLWGERQLRAGGLAFGHGVSSALDEAAWLVGSTIGVVPADLDSELGRVVTRPQCEAVRRIIALRISTRKPAAYLLNEAWFAGSRFYVDERVIVPRSLIGEFILEEFQPWISRAAVHRVLDLCTGSGCIAVAMAKTFASRAAVHRVLDLCTGSGCIAVAMAKTFAGAHVDAADISADAIDVARINVEAHGLGSRIRLVHSDLFSALAGSRYDIIVSNPPYVAAGEIESLPEEYRHEPELALASGTDGLQAVSRILAQAAEHLTAAGILVVEVGNSRELLEGRLPGVPFTWLCTQSGDESVFLLDREQLVHHASVLDAFCASEAGG
ncbi:MAG: 50S ribosomal protein L3 N(5)-glutamine methyltransferase [Pseudomonadota bacterium]|nr:50S ribosomal protein L3 N(5)-glutamine methyltransferase [Pseudomonadota bacterium]